jgi:hypothetical protein
MKVLPNVGQQMGFARASRSDYEAIVGCPGLNTPLDASENLFGQLATINGESFVKEL